jgi:nicotinamide-nucleotide amidase
MAAREEVVQEAVEAVQHAAEAVRALISRGLTVATAESLTGGLVCAALTAVPGASATVRGGLVLYATDLKSAVGGVDQQILQKVGPVAASTAEAMAQGVRTRLRSDVGVATTGVAGPDDQDGHPPGTVHVAVATPTDIVSRSFTGSYRLPGDRDDVRSATVVAALRELLSVVRESPDDVIR